MRVAQEIAGVLARELRMHRIGAIDHEQSARRRHVKPMPGRGHETRAGQRAVGIVSDVALQKIIVGISIYERRDVRADEAFFAIGDVDKRVEQIDRLLFVFRNPNARRIERQRAR